MPASLDGKLMTSIVNNGHERIHANAGRVG